jgi:hypothetical protein
MALLFHPASLAFLLFVVVFVLRVWHIRSAG